jgi:rhamnogalacturonyl hydrolase YesR
LLDLPKEDPIRAYLVATLEAQCEALQRLQTLSRFWHTLLNHSDSYTESSATAGFAFGILKAVGKRYIGKQYLAVGQKGIEAVLSAVNKSNPPSNISQSPSSSHLMGFPPTLGRIAANSAWLNTLLLSYNGYGDTGSLILLLVV